MCICVPVIRLRAVQYAAPLLRLFPIFMQYDFIRTAFFITLLKTESCPEKELLDDLTQSTVLWQIKRLLFRGAVFILKG